MADEGDNLLGCLLAILFIGFGVVQLIAGWVGIEETFGWGWGIASILAAVLFRFTLPIMVGAFLCARDIWEWHWVFALMFAAPGLLFMVPAIFTSLLGAIKR